MSEKWKSGLKVITQPKPNMGEQQKSLLNWQKKVDSTSTSKKRKSDNQNIEKTHEEKDDPEKEKAQEEEEEKEEDTEKQVGTDEEDETEEVDTEDDLLNLDCISDLLNRPTVQKITKMPEDCVVHTLLCTNGCFAEHHSTTEKRSKESWTHGIMSGEFGGGFVLNGTEEAETKFLQAYAYDVSNGIVHYIIEKRTKIFRFHADLDIKRKEPMSEENILALMKDLVYCVKKFYPSTTAQNRFDVVVCVSLGADKTGIHPIFPNLFVNVDQAFDIRNYYVSYLTSKYGDMAGVSNSWENIVDTSVYEANGLRMVGSHKSVTCNKCDGASRKKGRGARSDGGMDRLSAPIQICSQCGGRGKIDSGKVYTPYLYIRDGELHEKWTQIMRLEKCLMKSIKDGGVRKILAQLCSIRAPTVNSPSSDFAITDEETAQMSKRRPKNSQDAAPGSPKERIYKPIKTNYGTYRVTEEDYKGMSRFKNKQYLDPESEGFRLVQEYIQSKAFPSYWRKLQVHDIFSNPNKTFYIVNVRGEGQRFCLNNRKGNHKSNSIYFKIEPNSMIQKCYCSCQTIENRRHGKCEDFKSDNLQLHSKIAKILFPVAQQKLGHFSLQRNMENHLEMDEYTHALAEMICKLDEDHKQYLEEREARLQNGNGNNHENHANASGNSDSRHQQDKNEPKIKSLKRKRRKVD